MIILMTKKYSSPIVLGDYVEKGSVWSHKTIGDSRDRAQHNTKDWPLEPCKERNVMNDPLVDRDRILLPPQHIKLGLIKQFTKALDKDGDCFTYLCQAFPGLRSWKLASLTVLRSGSSSDIQISKTQWTKWNWKREMHLFW